MLRLFAVAVEMRREDNGADALRRLHAEQGEARFDVLRPVVHAGEDMRVQIDHGVLSSDGAPSGGCWRLL